MCKVVLIADRSEWQPNPADPYGGASAEVQGAFLARRVTAEVWNADEQGNPLSLLEITDFLIPEPYSTEAMTTTIEQYKNSLPIRNPDEGMVISD